MLRAIKLLLPALIPSWRFFDMIAPSPRIEFRKLSAPHDDTGAWLEFRPRPLRISTSDIIKNLFYNPQWNENLFLVSCAERVINDGCAHSMREIFSRIKFDLERQQPIAPYLQFRLALISRNGAEIETRIAYTSPVESTGG